MYVFNLDYSLRLGQVGFEHAYCCHDGPIIKLLTRAGLGKYLLQSFVVCQILKVSQGGVASADLLFR